MMVKFGIENLQSVLPSLAGKKIGLITNYTGLTSDFVPNYQILNQVGTVAKVFSPEHGFWGAAQAGKGDHNYVDPVSGLNIVSLYGTKHAPALADLTNIDVLVFDIPDVGVRYYTYVYTMYLSMKAAAQANLPFIVLDRPLPLGRQTPLGVIQDAAHHSFVGMLPIPNRYGLTMGELARWINDQEQLRCRLSIAPVIGWQPLTDFQANHIPWIPTSPNMPTLTTVALYPGTCLFEGTNLSEGRGTTKPFETFGAPWIIDQKRLAAALNNNHDASVYYRPLEFVPTFSKYANQLCHGVQVHILIQSQLDPFRVVFNIFKTLWDLYPDNFSTDMVSEQIGNHYPFIEYLAGTPINPKTDWPMLLERMHAEGNTFRADLEPYLLYSEEAK